MKLLGFMVFAFAFGGSLAVDLDLLVILFFVGAVGCAYKLGAEDRRGHA